MTASVLSRTDVVAATPDGAVAAECFGAGSARPVSVVANASELVASWHRGIRSCVISPGAGWSATTLRQVATRAAQADVQLGYLHGWAGTAEGLWHARKVALARPPSYHSVAVWSQFAGMPEYAGGEPLTEVLRADSDVVSVLRAGHRLLCIETHGNGVDAPIGSGQYLCARPARKRIIAQRTSLPCFHGGPCIRTPDGSYDQQAYVEPEIIQADILVWATCWGLLAADSPFDPSTALAARFALAPSVTCLLTSFRSVAASPARLLWITALLLEGRTVGEVAHQLNLVEEGGAAWIVIGDPLIRIVDDLSEPPDIDAGAKLALPPGVFRLASHAGTESPLVLSSASNRKGAGPRVFLDAWGSPPQYAGVHLAQAQHEYSVGVAQIQHLQHFRQPRRNLQFALSLMRWTRYLPYGAGVADHTSAERAVEEYLARQERLMTGDHLVRSRFTGKDDLPARLLRHEERTWRNLLTSIEGFLRDYVESVGGVPAHTYRRFAIRTTKVANESCPYCGGVLDVDLFQFTTIESARTSLYCTACSNIADLPTGWSGMVISGPSRIPPGETGFQVSVKLDEARNLNAALAFLSVQRVPFEVADSHPFLWLDTGEATTVTGNLPLTIRPDAHPGVYFLLAVVIADGDIIIGRRPITIGPDSSCPHRPREQTL